MLKRNNFRNRISYPILFLPKTFGRIWEQGKLNLRTRSESEKNQDFFLTIKYKPTKAGKTELNKNTIKEAAIAISD